jgi:hypothetical protein
MNATSQSPLDPNAEPGTNSLGGAAATRRSVTVGAGRDPLQIRSAYCVRVA